MPIDFKLNIPEKIVTVDEGNSLIVDETPIDYVTNDALSNAIAEAANNFATVAYVDQQDQAIEGTLTAVAQSNSDDITALANHITDDQSRWQSLVDLIANNTADMKEWVKGQIAGTNPAYDYNSGTTVIGDGGLLNIAISGSEWIAPVNGAIVCSIGGLLSLGASILVNGTSVWDSPVYLLSIQVGGDTNPSPEIEISAGDRISLSTVLSLGTALNVKFYPVVGIN